MTEKKTLETIIYGGAFNPPTRAHQAILQACVDYAEPRQAEVWLLPSASRKDKTINEPFERRLEMCDALVQDVMRRTVNIDINIMELGKPQPTETYNTVCELNESFADRNFTWVFGEDSVATMSEWNHGPWLIEQLSMLVIERPGYHIGNLGPRAVKLAVDTGDVSSTELRQRLADGADFEHLVSPSVGALLAR